MFRRGPAVAVSLVLAAGVLSLAPSAVAGDGGTAKDKDPCSDASTVKLKVEATSADRLLATGVVYSDDGNLWDWAFRHDGDVSADGTAKADGDGEGKSFRLSRTMVDFAGAKDYITFRAENRHTGEVCRAELQF